MGKLTPGEYDFNDNVTITSTDYTGSTISGYGDFKINAEGYTITFTGANKAQSAQTYVASFENSTISINADKIIVRDGILPSQPWYYENDANGLSFSNTTGIINADVEIANIIAYYDGSSEADTEGLEARNGSDIEINGNVKIVDVQANTSVMGVSIDNNSGIKINGNLDIDYILGGRTLSKPSSAAMAISLLDNGNLYVTGNLNIAKIEAGKGKLVSLLSDDSVLDVKGNFTINSLYSSSDITGAIGMHALNNGTLNIEGYTYIDSFQSKTVPTVVLAESGGKITLGNGLEIASIVSTQEENTVLMSSGTDSNITVNNYAKFLGNTLADDNGKILLNLYNNTSEISGDMSVIDGGKILMNMDNGGIFTGATYIDNYIDGSSINFDIKGANSLWNITNNSTISSLSLSDDAIVNFVYNSGIHSFLTIKGNYDGNNGIIIFNTVLEDDNSITDKMIVEGDTSGTTKVRVNNMGGKGAYTQNGIELISVLGTSDGEFVKDGRIVAGAYEYFLNRGDGITTDSNNWYLTNVIPSAILPPVTLPETEYPEISDPPLEESTVSEPIYRPESGSYLANARAVNSLFVHTLHDRLGETQYTDALKNKEHVSSIWVRNVGGYGTFRDSSNQLKTRNKKNVIQVGGDIADWSSNENNRYHLGIMAGYGFNHSKTESNKTSYTSKGETEGFNLGIYGTYYANKNDKSGFYADTWLTYSWFDNEVHGDELEKEKYKSKGITASLESGYSFKIKSDDSDRKTYYIQPKAQIIYMGVDTDDHTEVNGTKVETKGDGNIQTRIGARVYVNHFNPAERDNGKEIQPFVEANWIHNSKEVNVLMDDINSKIKGTKDIGEVKVGTEVKLNPNFNVWGNLSHQWGGSGYRDTKITIGLKYSF